MMMVKRALCLSAGLVFGALVLQGCEKIVYEPSHMSHSKMKMEKEGVFEDVETSQLNAASIEALSDHYLRNGQGKVDLSVTYDPKSKTNTAMHASNEIARITKEFQKNGVEVSSMILPVKGQGNVSRAQVSFDAYSVAAPDDCTMMSGYEDRNVDPSEDYNMGCTTDSIVAQQIARPRDLAGRADTSLTSDGRRASNIVERYRTGEPNTPLEGESASE